ncbi:MAG: hypothetical protein AAGA54_20965 [Myxococcota bacterium]
MVALWACAATSSPEPEPPPDDTLPPDFMGTTGWDPEPVPSSATLVLYNAQSSDAIVRVRDLSVGVDIDCDVVLDDPGALLSEALLGNTETWTVPAGDNLALERPSGRDCEAIRLEGDGFAPRWVVWRPELLPEQMYIPDEEPVGPGVLKLETEGAGAVLTGPESLLFVPGESPRGLEACAPTSDGRRLEWSTPLPAGGTLAEATWGPDGCGAIRFAEPSQDLPGQPWYLCVSEDAWPFEVGDAVEVSERFQSGTEGLSLFDAEHGRGLEVTRGSDTPSFPGLSVAFELDQGCGLDVDATCGTVTRVGSIRVQDDRGVERMLRPGEAVEAFGTRQARVEARVVQTRGALDPECAQGPGVLGPDIELLITTP